MANPFKPSFGSIPPILIGRNRILEDFKDGLLSGVGDPYRSILFTGARGVGKSVMLSELESIAQAEGYVTAKVMTSDSLLEDIYDQLLANASELLEGRIAALTSITLPVIGGGVGFEQQREHEFGWTTQFQKLVQQITEKGSGVFIAIDEIHQSYIDPLRRLFGTYQMMISSDLNVALAASGLPMAVSSVLNDDVLTFLRRATQYTLADVDLEEVAAAIESTVTENGRAIEAKELTYAAESTGGYPFMIQLVGYHTWRQHPEERTISNADVQAGVLAAQRRLGTTIHEVSLHDLSEVDRTFLAHMAAVETPTPIKAIIKRMGVSNSYANVYKNRLIEAGIIEQVGRGRIDFAIPYLKEYLKDHAAQYLLN